MDAGAGTGKTTVMSIRYIEHILCEDQRASRVLPKGPREPLSGQGALRIPRRQQQELEEWNGLLPPECVAITQLRVYFCPELQGISIVVWIHTVQPTVRSMQMRIAGQ